MSNPHNAHSPGLSFQNPLDGTSLVEVVPALSGGLGAGLSKMASPTTGSASNLPISFLQVGAVPPLFGGPASRNEEIGRSNVGVNLQGHSTASDGRKVAIM